MYDGEKRFSLVVRMGKDYRHSIDDIKYLTVPLPHGGQIPIEQLADVSIKEGPAQISRENTKRRITIGFNVRGGDVETIIHKIQDRIDAKLNLPVGYYVSFGGQFENLQQAKSRLAIAVPIALFLIFILLYFAFKSVKEALLIYTAVPMSVIGGILALWIRGMDFSISAGVGFIALFGIAVLNGIVLISEFNRLEQKGMTNIIQRVLCGIRTRIRPVMITATAASLGFFPMAISTSAGAEVQKPLATVVIGGLISATLLTLIVLPIFYIFFSSLSFKKILKRIPKSAYLILVSVMFISTYPLNGIAQRRVSLDEALRIATDKNLTIQSANYDIKMNKTLIGASLDIPKTELSGEYGKLNSYSLDNSFSISQSFSMPSVYSNQRKLAKANVKSSEFNRNAVISNVTSNIKRLYNEMVYLNEKLRLLRYQDTLYTRFTSMAEVRYKSGEAKKLELMAASSEQSEIRNRIVQTYKNIDICSSRMQTLLNLPERIYPSTERLEPLIYNSTTVDNAASKNPNVALIKQQVEKTDIEHKLESNRMLPDFKIGFSSQTIRGTQEVDGIPRTFGRGDRFNSIQFGVSVPLFFSSSKSKIKAAEIKTIIAKNDAEIYTQSIKNEYQALLYEYEKQQNALSYYNKQAVPEADMIISQSEYSYKQGEIAYPEYIVNVTKALEIKQNYIETINDYNQTVISLESTEGKIF